MPSPVSGSYATITPCTCASRSVGGDANRPGARDLSGEFAFIARLRALLPTAPAGEVWVGDDAAVLAGGLLLATDALVDGVHFDLRWGTLTDAGWKALAVNCSDLAAMGGTPTAAVAAVVLPPTLPGAGDALLSGLADAAAAFGCPLVGGDTTSGPNLVVSVAIVGRAAPSGAVLRSGARPGDGVFVTGTLGGAKAALDACRAGAAPQPGWSARMRRPHPRLAEGRAAAAAGATAMIDVSDGFTADLAHILAASMVGVRIESDRVPCEDGVVLADALAGGDDYELCFTAPDPDAVGRVFRAAGLGRPAFVGEITDARDGRVIVFGGDTQPLVARGWEHPIP